jgi:hypothetical protein
MNRYIALTLFTFSLQAKETFINHTSMKLQIQTEYSFCKVDAVEVPAQTLKDLKKGTVINSKDTANIKTAAKTGSLAIIPGEATDSSGKECCLSYMKIKTNAHLFVQSGIWKGESVSYRKINENQPGTFLYDYHFAGCKDRTFNIYEDSSKPNGIRVEW